MMEEKKRLLWARWQRLIRWEFWPVWAVYPPVLFWTLVQAIRLRGLTLWVNCNPGMRASGLALEEKGGILDSFKGEEGRVRIARYLRIAPGDLKAMEKLESFMAKFDLSYPIVLKPDFGQRGQGVEIVGNKLQAERWLKKCRDGVVVQEMIEGLEFGVHWQKFPNADKGEIRSICGKHPQFVVGSGWQSLEDLILEDGRAVLMHRYYFAKYRDQLRKIIPEGEKFILAPIGTHARGAVFTDERELLTDELRKAFDELGERFPGFNFGRYDVKVPSVADFQAGRNIVVLELNGVMGEPAHIYHPGYPWWKGVRDLCRQFQRATEIGAAWRELGKKPPEMGDVIELIRQHCEKDYLEVDHLQRK